MAKVKMLVTVSGTRDGKDWPRQGEELECSKREADDLVQGGLASYGDEDENALADVGIVETATRKGNKAVNARLAVKPAPHADEEAAYHNPVLPGEKASAEAGQKAVDQANKDDGLTVRPDSKAK